MSDVVVRRYTSPTQEIVVEGIDITGFDVFVTYRQGATKRTVEPTSSTYADGDTTLTVEWSQTDTARLREGPVEVQVNYVDASGKRDCTEVAVFEAGRNLLDEEVVSDG